MNYLEPQHLVGKAIFIGPEVVIRRLFALMCEARRCCRVRLRRLILSVPFALITTSVQASIFVEGEATVRSGDDLTVRGVPFHLIAIDAFELSQQCGNGATAIDCGARARDALQEITGKDEVICMSGAGSPVEPARCITKYGYASQEMVRRGWALARPDLAYDATEKKELCDLEAQAKRLKLGAWRYTFALPYVYRGEKGKPLHDVSCGNATETKP